MSGVHYCINGRIHAEISPLNRGFAYGDGVFRTMRLLQGELQDWPLHYQTLVADCSKLHIVCPSAELLMQELKHLMTALDDTARMASVIKIMITRGEGARGYAPSAISEPSRVLIQSPMPSYPADIYRDGIALYTCQTRLAHQPLLAGIKHMNRLENVLARAELKDPRFFDGLMLDYDHQVIEAVSGNLFIRKGDAVMTPSLTQCGVAGVMRQKLLDWYYTHARVVNVTALTLEDVLSADDVVVCNSIYGVLQVQQIDQHPLASSGWAAALRSQLKFVVYEAHI